jgi:OOP family OmpA-OmpF porin
MGGMKNSLIGFFIFSCWASQGQNLIVNPSFENFTNCPSHGGWVEFYLCKSWSDPAGTSDYFNTCIDTSLIINDKPSVYIYHGSQSPHSGSAFAGFFLFQEKDFYDREYLQTKLREPLLKDSIYRIQFYLSIGEKTKIYSDYISICFSKSSNLPFVGTNKRYPYQTDPLDRHGITFSCSDRVQIKDKKLLRSNEWALVESTYKAKGGEEFFSIGSFKEDMTKKEFKKIMNENINYSPPERHINGIKVLLGMSKICYYYIDDISVTPIGQKIEFTHQTFEH